MRIPPELSSCNIVLVGDLNPKIFRPDWFVAQELLTKEEGDSADLEILHSELSIFRIAWAKIHVDKKRFIAETEEAPFVRLSDFVTRTFGEFLIHTPISMLGINRRVHFPLKSLEEIDKIGKTLAPQEAWGEWGPKIDGGIDRAKHGGLRSLSMEQRNLSDREHGHIRAKVEPSTIVHNGIYMEINDHYQIADENNATTSQEIIQLLSANFESSINRSEWIIDQIMAIVR